MSSEYPLDPFTDFATREEPLEWDVPDLGFGRTGWAGWSPERRPEAVPSAGNYEGMGDDNPFVSP